MELDDTICYCFHISKRKIVNYVRIHEPRRASQISECGGAGTGCGWCIAYLKQHFEQWQQDRLDEPDAITPEEYSQQRGNYIREGHGVPAPGAIPPPPIEEGSNDSQ